MMRPSVTGSEAVFLAKRAGPGPYQSDGNMPRLAAHVNKTPTNHQPN